MSNTKIFILSIILSIIFNFSYAYRDCRVTSGFDVDKLEGAWKFIAGIGPKVKDGRCGYITLQRDSDDDSLFTGYRISWRYGRLVSIPIVVRANDETFIFQLKFPNGPLIELIMSPKTCNGHSEFAIEDPSNDLYMIFSRYNRASDALLRYYRALGYKIRHPLQMVQRNCC